MDGIKVTNNGNHVNYVQFIVADEETNEILGLVHASVLGGERPFGALGLVIPGEDRKYFGWHQTFEQAVAAVVLGIEVV